MQAQALRPCPSMASSCSGASSTYLPTTRERRRTRRLTRYGESAGRTPRRACRLCSRPPPSACSSCTASPRWARVRGSIWMTNGKRVPFWARTRMRRCLVVLRMLLLLCHESGGERGRRPYASTSSPCLRGPRRVLGRSSRSASGRGTKRPTALSPTIAFCTSASITSSA